MCNYINEKLSNELEISINDMIDEMLSEEDELPLAIEEYESEIIKIMKGD